MLLRKGKIRKLLFTAWSVILIVSILGIYCSAVDYGELDITGICFNIDSRYSGNITVAGETIPVYYYSKDVTHEHSAGVADIKILLNDFNTNCNKIEINYDYYISAQYNYTVTENPKASFIISGEETVLEIVKSSVIASECVFSMNNTTFNGYKFSCSFEIANIPSENIVDCYLRIFDYLNFSGSYSDYLLKAVHVDSSDYSLYGLTDEIMSGAKKIGYAFFGDGGVGTGFMQFLTTPANAICLIPLFSFLLVLGFISVKRLFRG